MSPDASGDAPAGGGGSRDGCKDMSVSPVTMGGQKISRDPTPTKPQPLVRTITQEDGESFGDFQAHFRLRELLGEGSFGSVYRCSLEEPDGAVTEAEQLNFAVKVIDATRLAMLLGYPVELVSPRLKREVEILQHLGEHPRILKLVYAFYSLATHRFYLVTELLTGGELFTAIVRRRRPYSEHDGRIIFAQLVDAVAFCHQMGVAHRDLKLENCLFENKESLSIKLCDYGQAKFLCGEDFTDTSQTLTTTPLYTAPEVTKAIKASQTYDAFKADSYGLGVILYGVLCSALPDATKGVAYERHRQWAALSDDAKNLITLLLRANPDERPSPKDIHLHPWLASVDDSFVPVSVGTSRSSSPSLEKRMIADALIACQEIIVGLQRERGTACWAVGGAEGESEWTWQVQYVDERLEEAWKPVHAVFGTDASGGEPDPDTKWGSLRQTLVKAQGQLSALRADIQERIARRNDAVDIEQELDATFDAYSAQIWDVIVALQKILWWLRGEVQSSAQSPYLMRYKLLQMMAEQVGRERAFISGHLVRPHSLRTATVVRRLAEIIGARKLLIGSFSASHTIVGEGLAVITQMGLCESFLDVSELSALETVENRILNATKVESPAVAECWHQLTKIIDKLHQHIMVCISDGFSALPP